MSCQAGYIPLLQNKRNPTNHQMIRGDQESTIKSGDTSHDDRNDVINEAFISKAVLLGLPTINRGILSTVAGFLEEIRGLGFREIKRTFFNTFGWSSETFPRSF